MEDFNLVLKNLISKDISQINTAAFSDSLKLEFDKTATVYVTNGNFLNAIKVFALTGNKNKLVETGNICLKNNLPYEAFYAFFYADDKINLDKVGNIFMQIPDPENALKAFKKSGNQEMILFIEANLI